MTAYPHRMRDLVRLTGMPGPTIHFYAQQGLLPAPHKTAGNQARYSDDTVRRLLWVRSLQQELRLPLRSIGWVLERHGEIPVADIRALLALGTLLEEPDPLAADDEKARLGERLDPGDVEGLRRLGLVATDGPRTRSDLRLAELVATMRAAGFTEEAGFSIDNLRLYADAVERLVQDELARIIEPVLGRHDPARLRDLVRSGLPIVDRLLALFHERAVQGELRKWLDLEERDTDRASA